MRRIAFFVVIGLGCPLLLTQDAQGHGDQKGSKILVSSSSHCRTPSKTRVIKKYKQKYTLRGIPTPTKAPSDHWHHWTETRTLRPGMAGYDTDCNTTRRVCAQKKYWHATCGRNKKSIEDRDCNDGAKPYDGWEVRGKKIHYWRWIPDLDNCWDELVTGQ